MNPSKLFELFDKARQHLKYPSLYFPDIPLKLGIGNDPKVIWVSNGFARSNPLNKLYGKFQRLSGNDMLWYPYNCLQGTADILHQICEDPLKYGALHGQQYKHCCFCNTELTSKASLFAGYGPICADNWGLPWGEYKDESLENL